MSRQGEEQERQMVPKRPRREDQLFPRLQPTMSMVPHIHGIDLMPTICGVHDGQDSPRASCTASSIEIYYAVY